VIDILRARSGVYHPAAYETPGMMKNRPQRGQYKPGEYWFYNNWDFNVLITIFEKQTSEKIFEAFKKRIADPLQLKDFDLTKQQYFIDSMSVHPATLWFMSASDMATVGLMLLNNGSWNGKTILDPSWIKESTAPYSDIGILGGYGYCWWAARDGNHFPFVTMPSGTYSARGTGEQILLVIPEKKIVLVHRTEVTSPQQPMMKVTDFGRLLRVVLE
jgi:CubicO group peptidase (beta-lactamase class C family)